MADQKISQLPETTGNINPLSLLALVQNSTTTKTTFSTLSTNIFDAGIKFGTYTTTLTNDTGQTAPIYTEQFFTNSSRYAIIDNNLVLFVGSLYVQSGGITNGTGIVCVSLPPLGVNYAWATGHISYHQGFQIQNNNSSGLQFGTIGCSIAANRTSVKLRALNILNTTGSPDIYYTGGPSTNPNCPVIAGQSLSILGIGFLA
jgi:hypothetical protein